MLISLRVVYGLYIRNAFGGVGGLRNHIMKSDLHHSAIYIKRDNYPFGYRGHKISPGGTSFPAILFPFLVNKPQFRCFSMPILHFPRSDSEHLSIIRQNILEGEDSQGLSFTDFTCLTPSIDDIAADSWPDRATPTRPRPLLLLLDARTSEKRLGVPCYTDLEPTRITTDMETLHRLEDKMLLSKEHGE